MSQKTIKHFAIIVFFFIAGSIVVMAQNTEKNGHGLSIAASFGLLSGDGEEIVYRDNITKNKLSQLLWKFEPLYYIEAMINYSWKLPSAKLFFFTDTSFKYGVPNNLGLMEDRDWFNANVLTHYSIHDITTETAILVDANSGVSFLLSEKFSIKPFIFYSFMNLKWSARGGEYWYPPANGGHGYINQDIIAVNYKQIWNIFGIGVSIHYTLNKLFDIGSFLKISPLVWCNTLDNHFLRDLVITDTMFGGFFVEYGFNFSIKITNKLITTVYAGGRYINGTRGYSVYDEEGIQPVLYNNIAGSGYNALNIGITATFKLF